MRRSELPRKKLAILAAEKRRGEVSEQLGEDSSAMLPSALKRLSKKPVPE